VKERRDLQGLQVESDSGHVAVVPKGGLPLLDGSNMRVPFRYRGGYYQVIVPVEADAQAIETAIAERLPEIDDELELAALQGQVIE